MASPLRRNAARAALAALSFFFAAEIALAAVPHWVAWRQRGAPMGGTAAGATIVLLGDSVTAGFGVRPGEGWGSLLGAELGKAGMPDVEVENRAFSGSSVAQMADATERGPQGATFLAMVGHNDFVRWTDIVNTRQPMTRGGLPEGALRWVPRLARVGWYAATGHAAQARLDAASVALFRRQMGRLGALVAEQRGHLVLLTYVVPGVPGEKAKEAKEAPEVLSVVRDGQHAINRLLRTMAAEAHLTLIDTEAAVPVSAEWSPTEFLDSIHPTRATHGLIAAVVASAVVDRGLIAPPEGAEE